MYEELIERLRHIVDHGDDDPCEYVTNMCGGCDACDQAADAIERIGMSWDDSKRYAAKLERRIEVLQADNNRLREMWAKATSDLSKCRAELEHFREVTKKVEQERDAAVADLHEVLSGGKHSGCDFCAKKEKCAANNHECAPYSGYDVWEWRGVNGGADNG